MTAFRQWALTAGLVALTGGAHAGDVLRLFPRESSSLAQPGATAAYAVDGAVVEATAEAGSVTVRALGVGATEVIVVFPDRIANFSVAVQAPPAAPPPPDAVRAGGSEWTRIDESWDSATARVTSGLEIVAPGYRLAAVNVTRTDQAAGEARSSMPEMTLELGAVTLLDARVDRSPLTVDGATLRGVHVHTATLDLQAGATSPYLYQGLFLPTNGAWALGASYTLRSGLSALTPNVYYYPDGGGPIATLLFERGGPDDPLRVRAEAGWGGVPAGALQVTYESERQRLWLDVRHRPRELAGLTVGRPRGSLADLAWTLRFEEGATIDTTASLARYELPALDQRSGSAETNVRIPLWERLSMRAGVAGSLYDAAAGTVRSLTVPAGLSWDGRRLGLDALYRYRLSSQTNAGGSGGRVSARLSLDGLYATVFADYQEEAATLDLIFRAVPELERLFTELGLSARTPEELATLLATDPALAQLGYLQGATVNLRPWRLQTGGEIAWSGPGRRLLLHVLVDRTAAVDKVEQTGLASLAGTLRLARGVEIAAEATAWSRDADLAGGNYAWSIAGGIKLRIDGAPHFRFGGGTIDGRVDGSIAGMRARLDGGEETAVDANGRFGFHVADGAAHRVEVILPPGSDAYFTTPSTVQASAGADLAFGVASAPARLAVAVRDDAGAPLAGIAVRLAGGGAELRAVSDSDGGAVFAAPPGGYVATIERATVAAGYDPAAAPPVDVRLSGAAPASISITVPAARSVGGKAPDGVVVRLVEAEREVRASRDGRYLFRRLAPGTYTLAAEIGGRHVERTVVVPAGPATIRDVDL